MSQNVNDEDVSVQRRFVLTRSMKDAHYIPVRTAADVGSVFSLLLVCWLLVCWLLTQHFCSLLAQQLLTMFVKAKSILKACFENLERSRSNKSLPATLFILRNAHVLLGAL